MEPSAALGDANTFVTFAGVDEAGLGPLLGPLCFGFSVFRAPRGRANLWETLADVVSANPSDLDGRDGERFAVADSKQVFSRNPRGERRLERTALGFLALLDPQRRPLDRGHDLCFASPRELAPTRASIQAHPWYTPLEDSLPRHVDRGLLELGVERLHRALGRQEVSLLDAGVRVVLERDLNVEFERLQNKGSAVWSQLAPILDRLYRRHAAQGLRLSVDRQGGRAHYAAALRELFPDSIVDGIREREGISAYTVRARDGSARMRITFAERGESRSFAIALGSCLAKYARETAMAAFNANFCRLDPALQPTAGYTTDGRRWLADAGRALELARVEPASLARTR